MATRKVFEAKVTIKLVDRGEDESVVERWLSNRLSSLQDVEEAYVESVERVKADDEDEETPSLFPVPPTVEEKAEIKDEYLAKRGLYLSMVGTLYPGIAYEQLMRLRERYVVGTDSFWGDLPPVKEPHADGSAPSS